MLLVGLSTQNSLIASSRTFNALNIAGRSSSDRKPLVLDSIDSTNCAKKSGMAFCIAAITATVITCSILYQPYYTHVQNDTSDKLLIKYPGCTNEDDNGKSHNVDCQKTVWPDDSTTIVSSGHLTRLCATNSWGFGKECATNDALEECNDFKVTKRNGHYVFGRKCKSNDESSSNSTSTSNSTATEFNVSFAPGNLRVGKSNLNYSDYNETH